MKPLSIYIHIPFCVQKCHYCDFLSGMAGEEEKKEYIEALLVEIEEESENYKSHQVQTIFIGGGTPSFMDERDIERILCKLYERFQFADPKNKTEITIEVNPGTVSGEKLKRYSQAGINRLSIGMQSANEEELKLLGRIHDWSTCVRTYEDARKAGFSNVNIDIMWALPGQDRVSYEETLRKVMALKPEHISAYSLIIEEETPFYDRFGRGKEHLLPTEEEERQMYHLTGDLLERENYTGYEISNYARQGYECRHNMVYWQRGEYVGFGLGAASMVGNVRWNNTRDQKCYMDPKKTIKENQQILTIKEQMEEFMFLGLRLTRGVSRAEFYNYFQQEIEDVYGEVLLKLEQEKLIQAGAYIRLTPYGRDISNYVMAEFLF